MLTQQLFQQYEVGIYSTNLQMEVNQFGKFQFVLSELIILINFIYIE